MDYTPTQQRLMDILNDGKPHPLEELSSCLYDEMTDQQIIRQHIYLLRIRLRKEQIDVICRSGHYQLIKF